MDSLKTSLPLTAHHLIQLANDNGGYDNITVALVRVLGDASARKPAGWLRRLLNRFTKVRR
jgi:serine/threonine protein phosphatase PrpC